MVAFAVPAHVQPAVCVVGAHGLTDVLHPRRAAHSLLALAVPLPGPMTTLLFGAASVRHLARELGVRGSVALHVLVAGLALWWYGVAWSIMCAVLLGVHVPAHLARVAEEEGRARAIGVFVAGVVVAFACADASSLGHLHQRVVAAHVLAHERHP